MRGYLDRDRGLLGARPGRTRRATGRRTTTRPCTAGTCWTRCWPPRSGSRSSSPAPRTTTSSNSSSSTTPRGPRGRSCTAPPRDSPERTLLESIADLADDEGIECLVVVLGSSNALGSVLSLEPAWTPPDYAKLTPAERAEARQGCNLWRPSAFEADWSDLVAGLRTIKAQHRRRRDRPVGHDRADRPRDAPEGPPRLPLLPVLRAALGRRRRLRPEARPAPDGGRGPGHRLRDRLLQRDDHRLGPGGARRGPRLARLRHGRRAGPARRTALHQQPVGAAGLVDAVRAPGRADPARPGAEHPVLPRGSHGPHRWWAVLAGRRPPDDGRLRDPGPGGHLDPELRRGGVPRPATAPRGPGPITVDFDRLLRADTLVSDPPISITGSLGLLGWLDERLDWVTRFLPFVHSPL